MKRDDFFELLSRFADCPIPAIFNRHIYFWMGELDDLLSNSPVGLIVLLDLHKICESLTKIPNGDKAAGRELSNVIEEWIKQEFLADQHQRALLVTGLDLLYRYRLSLSTFSQLANENTAIILSLSSLDVNFWPNNPFPSFIHYSPDQIQKYVVSEIPDEAIVTKE